MPLLSRLDPARKVPQILVLTPTRELAVQVREELEPRHVREAVIQQHAVREERFEEREPLVRRLGLRDLVGSLAPGDPGAGGTLGDQVDSGHAAFRLADQVGEGTFEADLAARWGLSESP